MKKDSVLDRELVENMLGKAYIRQADQETHRLKLAMKITKQIDKEHSLMLPSIPAYQIERVALDPLKKQRYLKRVKDLKSRKYKKYWQEYHIGNGRPANIKTSLDSFISIQDINAD